MDMNKKIKVMIFFNEEPCGPYIMTAMQERLLNRLLEDNMLREGITYCVIDDKEAIDLTREEF